jgi:hypothetical protein
MYADIRDRIIARIVSQYHAVICGMIADGCQMIPLGHESHFFFFHLSVHTFFGLCMTNGSCSR